MACRVGGKVGAAQARALGSQPKATPRLGALRMLVLATWGEADQVVPVSAGRALMDALPHAHFHVLRSCGHLPTLEEPAECAELFVEFLEDEAGHAP